ncbi:g6529 [Coccomyxa viridis]|uniref:G6529 protein n=1 Tax=Coccomyxa viridis TaxID=1274662 RepID=A0ABP1FVL4_9CHLO
MPALFAAPQQTVRQVAGYMGIVGDFICILLNLARALVWAVPVLGILGATTNLIGPKFGPPLSFNQYQPCQGTSPAMEPWLTAAGGQMLAVNTSGRLTSSDMSFTPSPTPPAARGGAQEAEKAGSGGRAVQAKADGLNSSGKRLALRGLEVAALQAKAGTGPNAPALYTGRNPAESGDVSFHPEPKPESGAAAGSTPLPASHTYISPPKTSADSGKQNPGTKKGMLIIHSEQ